MKKKFVSLLLAFILLFINGQIVLGDAEDYTTFTEVDVEDKITVDTSNVTVTDIEHEDVCYLYKDKGVNYFDGDYEVAFSINITSTEANSLWSPFMIANALAPYDNLDAASEDYHYIQFYATSGSAFYLSIIESDSGTLYADNSVSLSTGTEYYLMVERDEAIGTYGRLYCYIYDDESRTSLVDTVQVDLHEQIDFRYIYQVNTKGGWLATGTTGYLRGMDLSPISIPTVTTSANVTVWYDSFNEFWRASVNGTITDSGGELLGQGFYLKTDNATEYETWGYGDLEADNVTFSCVFDDLTFNETYDFYAMAWNTAGTGNGTEQQFTVSQVESAPAMTTYAYPINLNPDGLWANVYGEVTDYGGANVTGLFYYKLSDNSTWLLSANTTDLISGNTYSANLTGLEVTKQYDYMAVGINAYGTGYGSIGTFTLLEIVAPTFNTLPADDILSTSAWLNGYLESSGDSSNTTSAHCYFEYRETGTSSWTETPHYLRRTGHYLSYQLTSLSPNTNYEFRAVAYSVTGSYECLYSYGDIRSFLTYPSISVPVVQTGNVTYLSPFVIRSDGLLIYDGGSDCVVYHQLREKETLVWNNSPETTGANTNDTFYTIVSGLEATTYEYRWVSYNEHGTGYGSILEFILGTDGTIVDEEDIVTESVTDLINTIRNNLGLTGTFGTWAFLGLILLVEALLFGIGISITENPKGKTAVGVSWLLTSVATVGAFMFSGQLGIWPIFILVGGLVLFVMIILSIKLSGGRDNG